MAESLCLPRHEELEKSKWNKIFYCKLPRRVGVTLISNVCKAEQCNKFWELNHNCRVIGLRKNCKGNLGRDIMNGCKWTKVWEYDSRHTRVHWGIDVVLSVMSMAHISPTRTVVIFQRFWHGYNNFRRRVSKYEPSACRTLVAACSTVCVIHCGSSGFQPTSIVIVARWFGLLIDIDVILDIGGGRTEIAGVNS